MSGICDTCRREPCHMRFDGCKTCDVYEGGETRFEKLFGTPERAARTLNEHDTSCHDCLLGAYCGEECLTEEEPKLLEWLRGDAE